MITSEQEFLKFLDAHGFACRRVEHPAVFTRADAERHRPDADAAPAG